MVIHKHLSPQGTERSLGDRRGLLGVHEKYMWFKQGDPADLYIMYITHLSLSDG